MSDRWVMKHDQPPAGKNEGGSNFEVQRYDDRDCYPLAHENGRSWLERLRDWIRSVIRGNA